MKWYFASNVNGLRQAFYQIEGAVRSCLSKTKLTPIMLLDDKDIDDDGRSKVALLESLGVRIIRHRASMLDLLTDRHGDLMRKFSGHWLRCDIPDIETEDEYILYTDIDVVFMRDLPEDFPKPEYIACAPEHHKTDYSYFNSGVMIINVPGLRPKLAELREIIKSRLETAKAHDDQGALNALFRGQWLHLGPEWNWKPYWGVSEDALILHFHGPKPRHVEVMMQGNLDRFGEAYKVIYLRNPEAYAHYVKMYAQIV